MEDTLGEKFGSEIQKPSRVLILVLMEDTLGEKFGSEIQKPSRVLILVLMEDTLGGEQNLRILEFRGFDNSKTYKIGFC